MKQVTVVIRPGAYDGVMAALRSFGIRGLTVTRIFGAGRRAGGARDTSLGTTLAPHTRLDILATDLDAGDIVRVVAAVAEHGLVWVSPVDQVVRVRTAEYGIPAL